MSQKRYLQIVNFDEQLHYKDKNPIWIKLYCSLLDDYEFAQIADQTKFHAIGLMILAARLNNRLPDDEAWLRQKINANTKINLNLLLEIKFLEPIKGARKNARNSFNHRKPNKLNGELSRAVFESDLAQNRTEQKKIEENTTQHNGENADEKNVVVVCDSENFQDGKPEEVGKNGNPANGHSSIFSLSDCLRYAEAQPNATNPHGLANHLFKTGTADAFILAALYPEKAKAEEARAYGEPINFSSVPCSVCFGAKMADSDGRGYRKCEHCRDERGKSTGYEPTGRNER